MPRRSILTDSERDSLFTLRDNQEDLIRYYSFSEPDLSIIRQHRGAANKIGFAIQLCYMRYPGIILSAEDDPSMSLLQIIAQQIRVETTEWAKYACRAETRREHRLELQNIFGFRTFSMDFYRTSVESLDELAWQTDKGILLAEALMEYLRTQLILLPSINVIERICAEAITKSTRRIYSVLTEKVTPEHLSRLDSLLSLKPESKITMLSWLRQPTGSAKARRILEHIKRL
jgi:TnpA family transposase